jgi:tight adherence protein B
MLLIALVFGFLFLGTAFVIAAAGSGAAKRAKQTSDALDAALATSGVAHGDEFVDVRKSELFSAVPWINRWLVRLEIAPKIRQLLYQADLKWTAGRLFLMCGACWAFSGYVVYYRTGAALPSMLISLVLGALPLLYVIRKRAQRFAKFEQVLPEALDLMVSAIRAGQSLTSALGVVAKESQEPVRREFRHCFDEQAYGLELRTAMENLAARVPLQDVRIIATAILVQKESGGNLAEVLDKTSEVIRERFRLNRQIRIHTAQGRMSGWILTIAPVALGFLLYLMNPEQESLLWTTSIGVKMLYGAAVMTILGGLFIRKIVRIRI